MKILKRQRFIWAAVLILFEFTVRAQNLNTIGVTTLWAVTTNLNGSGVRVAQAEAPSGTEFEVNPAVVGQPTNRFTYFSASGSASSFPNSIGTELAHADQVAANFYGISSGVATNVMNVDNFDANYFISNYIENASLPDIGDAIVNQSFTFNALPVNQQQQVDSEYDNYSMQNNTLFVSAADNYSFSTNVAAPGTSYNCISVGAYDGGTFYNSVGPTIDNGRCKPDITAVSTETSFSTPQVAGAAAVLLQAALRGDGGSDTNSAANLCTIKALLLNGAIKPIGWTNSNRSPLDARYGAGVLNVFNAYEQLAGGKNNYIANTTVSTGGVHPPNGASGTISVLNGWDFNTNTSGNSVISLFDSVNHYYLNVTNGSNFIVNTTLVWNRHYNANYLVSPQNINNLNLFLYNCANSNLVNCSTSVVDNVEHIYMTNLPAGRYDLQVWKAGGLGIVSAAEPYALAWAFEPLPTLVITNWGTNVALTWPLYPAGFLVEAETNLLSANWNTNNLATQIITNGQNYLPLNATNAAQFFRLCSPNF